MYEAGVRCKHLEVTVWGPQLSGRYSAAFSGGLGGMTTGLLPDANASAYDAAQKRLRDGGLSKVHDSAHNVGRKTARLGSKMTADACSIILFVKVDYVGVFNAAPMPECEL